MPGAESGLGGDWYDLFPLPGDRLGVVMGDVSGHGLEAAVIMGRLRSALRAYALDCESPAEVLGKLDRKANHFEHGAMATVAYGVFDTEPRVHGPVPRRAPAAGAGRPGERRRLRGRAARSPDRADDRAVPGGARTVHRRCRRARVLAFYTDGLVERRDRPVDAGMAELARTLRADDPDRVCAQVMATMIGNRAAQDDVALLAIRREVVPAGG